MLTSTSHDTRREHASTIADFYNFDIEVRGRRACRCGFGLSFRCRKDEEEELYSLGGLGSALNMTSDYQINMIRKQTQRNKPNDEQLPNHLHQNLKAF